LAIGLEGGGFHACVKIRVELGDGREMPETTDLLSLPIWIGGRQPEP
jgi:hypothetical protein